MSEIPWWYSMVSEYQGVPILRRFRWYRRLIGGKWAIVTGFFSNARWVHVSDECVERVDEDWK